MFPSLELRFAALSGDFCIEADQNAYDLIINSNSNEMQQQLLLYYTGDCTTDNTIVDTIIASQTTAMEIIEMAMPVLDAVSFSFFFQVFC